MMIVLLLGGIYLISQQSAAVPPPRPVQTSAIATQPRGSDAASIANSVAEVLKAGAEDAKAIIDGYNNRTGTTG